MFSVLDIASRAPLPSCLSAGLDQPGRLGFPIRNAIRPFVVGRKGWLFAGSPDGAETSALLYPLVETAKANGLAPHAYLTYPFEHLPAASSPEAIAALLPHNLTLDDIRPQGAIL